MLCSSDDASCQFRKGKSFVPVVLFLLIMYTRPVLFLLARGEAETSRPARIEQGKKESWRLSLPGPLSPAHTTTRCILIAYAIVTEMLGRDNRYSALPGARGPSPLQGEVWGRLFWWGNCVDRIVSSCTRTRRGRDQSVCASLRSADVQAPCSTVGARWGLHMGVYVSRRPGWFGLEPGYGKDVGPAERRVSGGRSVVFWVVGLTSARRVPA
jgi:hypothetical protein